MKEIKVSIIIPCYNDGEYLLEAIESVRKYKEKNYEIIIINDGSKDKKTLKTLKDLKKQKNIILINQKHQGPSTARNNGIKKSKAEYIFFLDADNKIEPEYLKQGLKILDKNKEIGIVYSDVKFFGEEERIINLPEFNFERLLFKNYIDTCAMVRKQVWKDVKGFDTKLDKYTWEDWIFWINAYKKGWKFYHIPKVLFYYRVKKQSRDKIVENKKIETKLFNYISKKYGDEIYKKYKKDFLEKNILQATLKHKEKELENKQTEINIITDKLKHSENENENIKISKENIENSLTWRTVQKFDKIIKIFFPYLIRKIKKIKNPKEKEIEKLKNIQFIPPKRKIKKILFINHEESRTGAPKIIFNIAKEMKEKFEVKIISLRKGSMHNEFIEEFKNITYPEYFKVPYKLKIENAIKIILKEKPDLIYVNSIVSHAYARIGRKLKIPTILHVHELKESFNSISLEINLNNFKNLADKFIAVSQKVKSFLIKEINCNPKKIVLINEFSSSEEVLKKANEKSIREIHREINKKKDEILIVGIGTACKRKGIDILIKAHKLLKKRGYNNIKIIWTGLLIEEKEIITAILKRDKNFLFLGEKINPFPYLNSADIFVLPSREDPFPLVVLEAMALGKPSIVFKDGGGIPEAVKNCGIIVKKMNSEKLANAILKLSQNKKLIQAFSINCKKKQKEKYDSKIIIPKIYNLIEKELKK